MAHIPPVANNRLLGKRVYRLIDAKTREGILRRCGFTLLWTTIALVWLGFDLKNADFDTLTGMANASVAFVFCSLVFFRALLGVFKPQGYFNLFIAPRVLKEMKLTQRMKIIFSRSTFTVFAILLAAAMTQGESGWITYWAVFSVVSYLSIFLPLVNEFATGLALDFYNELADWRKVPNTDFESESDDNDDDYYYSPAYSNLSCNTWHTGEI